MCTGILIYGLKFFTVLLAAKISLLIFFCFVGDVNGNHEKWLGCSTPTVQGKAAVDFASPSGWETVTELTHTEGGILDLVWTDAHDLVTVRVVPPIGISDHNALFIDVVLEQPKPYLVCRQV